MSTTTASSHGSALPFGSSDLTLPPDLREPLQAHLRDLKQRYLARGWGQPVGFGKRPALIVIDLAKFWTQPQQQIGTNLDSVIDGTLKVLAAAREAKIPIFFTSFAYDPADPPSPQNVKLQMKIKPGDEKFFELDERMNRKPTEKLILKRYASCFKGTTLHEMLTSLGVDTLIVTGASTSHCVYATCRDATDSFRVIVPKEAVGERCEIMHEVNLLDIDIDLGDVMPVDDVVAELKKLPV
ncbi:MAG: isochorismatase family protein [Planctomycetota bacterium]|nr:isochorismatase family protein [Planctomycetota bacterium]MDA1213619.1 isochorismatase family protein [Planctomycetota bacterium]